MSKGLEVNVEMGLCTKDMAKENPIKDFEILIEEYKDKWSTQMYDYFKECLNEIKKKEKALEIIKEKGIILQFIKETYTAEQYNAGVFGTLVKPLTKEEYDLLKEVLNK